MLYSIEAFGDKLWDHTIPRHLALPVEDRVHGPISRVYSGGCCPFDLANSSRFNVREFAAAKDFTIPTCFSNEDRFEVTLLRSSALIMCFSLSPFSADTVVRQHHHGKYALLDPVINTEEEQQKYQVCYSAVNPTVVH